MKLDRAVQPPFIQRLREVFLEEGWDAAYDYMHAHGVGDEWLFDVLNDSLKAWEKDPEAGLDLHSVRSETPPFKPTFEQPEPAEVQIDSVIIVDADNNAVARDVPDYGLESPEDFAKRLTADFEKQLRAHIKKISDVWHTDPRQPQLHRREQLGQHALWTAQRFCGIPFERIAGANPMYDESSIRKAVTRFSDRIGLTLPTVGKTVGSPHKNGR